MQQDKLIALVDNSDKVIGFEEKQLVHEKGLLHRAFSIFIFNKKGELLLHQRALNKYHSPSLWTNTCCSHLLQDMTMEKCTHDRLNYEMGFDCNLDFQFSFTYKTMFGNGLTEYETDHIYTGNWNGSPNPTVAEVMGYKWISKNELLTDAKQNPNKYTYWLRFILENYSKNLFPAV